MKFWTIELAKPARPELAVVIAVGDDGTLIVSGPKSSNETTSHGSRAKASMEALKNVTELTNSGHVQVRDVVVLEVARATPETITSACRKHGALISAEVEMTPVDAFKHALKTLSEPAGETVGKLTANAVRAGDVELGVEGGGYLRPNGEEYFPRTIGAHEDVAVLRKLAENGRGALFFGSPGCGKTALVEAAFPDVVTLVGSRSTEYADFVGRYLPDPDRPGAYCWFDGPLVEAMINGKPFFGDEIALIDPQELSLMYPLMDGRDYIMVPERPDAVGGPKVVAQPGFCIMGAFNPYAPGARISEALWSRFTLKVEYTTDYKLARGMKVNAAAVNAAVELDKALRGGESDITWAPQMRELLRFKEIEELLGLEFAVQSFAAEAPIDVRGEVLEVMQKAFPEFKVSSLVTSVQTH